MTDEELREVLGRPNLATGCEQGFAEGWTLCSIRKAMRCVAAQVRAETMGWQPIETAPKDGTIFDVWLGDADASDLDFYCDRGTRRSPSWQWWGDKFRPAAGLKLLTFVQPTHWIPLPDPPRALLNKDGAA